MKHLHCCAAAAALAGGPVASAEFIGVAIDGSSVLPGTFTFNIALQFSDPDDQVLGIIGTPGWPLLIESALGLVNDPDSPTAGTYFDDLPVPWAAEWDTWVTVGDEDPTEIIFTDGFADGIGGESVIEGCEITEIHGGWLDGDPESAEDGGQVRIMHITVPFNSDWRVRANVVWQPDGTGAVEVSPFEILLDYPASCREDLDRDGDVDLEDLIELLKSWGVCDDTCCNADITGDGVIGFNDLQMMLTAWGPC